ncbi:MAG: anaerobic ribonucleoside-triphosphate reductase activating protein [Fusobacteria bacterium]|nr:MAG: anaerobic ribonucleoside-triphosphate reductase activating protein [Fusobacteriota bacterium]KAF0230167.1 MAG: anaerobic ribonucleoside-triphosphate reductase activating [Fusobacteriota bacterium]
MKYAQIRECDIANGEGIRVSLFVTGCLLNCPGCFNKNYQDFNFGIDWNDQEQNEFIYLGKREFIDGYSILGGEPLLQGRDMLELVKAIKMNSGKSIWLWTGLVFEELNEIQSEIIKFIDVLVDGPFIENLKDRNLQFKGSKNQRIIDVQKTLLYEKIIEF